MTEFVLDFNILPSCFFPSVRMAFYNRFEQGVDVAFTWFVCKFVEASGHDGLLSLSVVFIQ